jgi:outer membrane cobalamin receptor
VSRRRSTRLLPLALLVAVGCASAERAERDPFTSAGRLITAAAIERSGARNGWEALRTAGTHMRLREDARGNPSSVTARGHSSIELSPNPLLLVDGAHIDSFDYLRDIPAYSIESIRILDGTEGTRYFGTGAGNGVILVSTRTRL